MKSLVVLCTLVLTGVVSMSLEAAEKSYPLAFQMTALDGSQVDLSKYKGKVVMIVNVASRCGYTSQYAPMQQVYENYKDKGFVILGFPCNQFGGQEPGTAEQIESFCSANYGVTFDMFDKVDVNGPQAAPLYQHLTSEKTNPKYAGKIGWNFEKFLINKKGEVVARYRSGVSPDDDVVIAQIEKELRQ